MSPSTRGRTVGPKPSKTRGTVEGAKTGRTPKARPKSSRKPAARVSNPLQDGREVLEKEIQGLRVVQSHLGEDFVRVVDLLHGCSGRVVVTGLGKSGIVAQKIAATLTSTGTRSQYLHPVEAAHGDMGILATEDVLVVVSYSGANEELDEILSASRGLGIPIVALTGQADSPLANRSDHVLDCQVPEEACPMGLAPTTSTTAALGLGDALAVAVLKKRDFRAEEFARMHPSGVLGRRLRLTVGEVMRRGPELPLVGHKTRFREVLPVMMEKRLGCVFVEDGRHRLVGIMTDGDLKRILVRETDVMDHPVGDLMVRNPKRIEVDELVVQALLRMEENPSGAITQLAVVDSGGRLTGAVHMHDIVRLGLGNTAGGSRPRARSTPRE